MALVALGRDHELAMHIRAAQRNGLTRGEIGEVLLERDLLRRPGREPRAFAIFRDVLAEEEGQG